jgi:hypothetical protein
MSNQTLESERKTRTARLHQHQTRETQNLEMMEKIAVAIDDAISPLQDEMTDEYFSISISSRMEGVPGICLELYGDPFSSGSRAAP